MKSVIRSTSRPFRSIAILMSKKDMTSGDVFVGHLKNRIRNSVEKGRMQIILSFNTVCIARMNPVNHEGIKHSSWVAIPRSIHHNYDITISNLSLSEDITRMLSKKTKALCLQNDDEILFIGKSDELYDFFHSLVSHEMRSFTHFIFT